VIEPPANSGYASAIPDRQTTSSSSFLSPAVPCHFPAPLMFNHARASLTERRSAPTTALPPKPGIFFVGGPGNSVRRLPGNSRSGRATPLGKFPYGRRCRQTVRPGSEAIPCPWPPKVRQAAWRTRPVFSISDRRFFFFFLFSAIRSSRTKGKKQNGHPDNGFSIPTRLRYLGRHRRANGFAPLGPVSASAWVFPAQVSSAKNTPEPLGR